MEIDSFSQTRNSSGRSFFVLLGTVHEFLAAHVIGEEGCQLDMSNASADSYAALSLSAHLQCYHAAVAFVQLCVGRGAAPSTDHWDASVSLPLSPFFGVCAWRGDDQRRLEATRRRARKAAVAPCRVGTLPSSPLCPPLTHGAPRRRRILFRCLGHCFLLSPVGPPPRPWRSRPGRHARRLRAVCRPSCRRSPQAVRRQDSHVSDRARAVE